MITTRVTRRGVEEKRGRGAAALVFLFFLNLLGSGCGPNEGVLKSGKETPQANAASDKSPFEQDLDAMRNADFIYVYVLRRKDGGMIGAEDRGVIKLHTSLANRRVSSDDDKAFIIGSNTPLPPPNLMALYDRFAVENYSQPPPANTNVNSNEKVNSNK